MKKIFALLFAIVIAFNAKATVTFTLVTPPCDTNGVLVIQYTGFSLPPFHVDWYYGAMISHHIMTGFRDTIHNFNGYQATMVMISDSVYAFVDSGSYIGTPPVTFDVSSTSAVCPALGTITANVTSTTGAPFTYKWYQMSTGAVIGTTPTLSVPSGNYGIWITNSLGCSSGTPVTGLSDSVITTTSFMDSITTTPANCTNGTASLVTTTGTFTPPLSYLWSNGSTATSISGLSSGWYTLVLTDASGCSYTNYGYVNQTITISAPTTPTPATCLSNDGAVIAFGAGGMPPYSYSWSNGATTQNITGLVAGSYYVTVTDANGCTGSGSAYVSASTPITVTYAATPSSCTAPTGTASLYITGGTTPYRDTFYTSPIQTGTIATSLAAATYEFHVVDAVGCVQNGSVVVPPIDNMTIDFTSYPATCTLSNGSLNVYETGGVAPISYLWSTGATTSSITSVPTGLYNVTITDANGCSKTKTGYVDDYSPLSLGVSSVPASCIFTSDGSATVAPYGGTAPYTYTWSNGIAAATIGVLPTGPYWVYVTDHVGCTGWAYDYVGYSTADSSCYCTIKGKIYHDANVNCIRDAGEAGIPNIQVYCTGIGYTYTDDSGNYSFIVPSGSYTISESVQVYYPLSGCQMNNIPVTVAASSGCVHTVDFANVYDTLHDMQISTWDYNYPVPGNSYTQITVIHNAGSITEAAPVASYKADGQVYGASFVPSTVFTGGTTTSYDYYSTGGLPSFIPGASQTYLSNYTVPTSIPLGTNIIFKDTVAYIAPLDSWITDYAPWNNVNYFTSTIVGSFDPNFKEVTPKGYGANGVITLADSNLQYMVHFQNTGTANAQNIVVIDTLDNNLDWTTLRPVYASAPCKITTNVTGKIVKFTFSNIDLPYASSNSLTSNGMFTYSIKMKHGLVIGDQIRNSASIYFDYNAPVKTNTTLNTIGWPVSTPNVLNPSDFFTVFPNPTDNSFNATISANANCNATLSVSDITGKLLINMQLSLSQGSQTISVDVNHLSSGIYLVTVFAEGKTQTKKLAIVK